MPHPGITAFGWLMKLPDGSMREYASDAEALEALREAEEAADEEPEGE